MKFEFGLVGVVLAALVGYLVGAVVVHPPPGDLLLVLGALIGALVAVTILVLGEALKDKR